MAVERVGLLAPWRWLQLSAALLRRQPRALTGGAALLVAFALFPSLVQLLLLQTMPAQANAIQGLAFALSLLVYPPAVGGYLQLLHAADGDLGARPNQVLAAFADGPLARRLVILNLLFVALSLLAISLISFGLDGEALKQFVQQVMALKPGATTLPPLPRGTLPVLLAMALAIVALVTAQGFANAQSALREQQPLAALAAGLAAAWRNFGALLLFYLPLSIGMFLVGMLVALAAALASMLVAAVLGQAVAGVLVILVGVAVAIVLYALLFGFFYYAWRELFDAAPPPAQPHSIAV